MDWLKLKNNCGAKEHLEIEVPKSWSTRCSLSWVSSLGCQEHQIYTEHLKFVRDPTGKALFVEWVEGITKTRQGGLSKQNGVILRECFPMGKTDVPSGSWTCWSPWDRHNTEILSHCIYGHLSIPRKTCGIHVSQLEHEQLTCSWRRSQSLEDWIAQTKRSPTTVYSSKTTEGRSLERQNCSSNWAQKWAKIERLCWCWPRRSQTRQWDSYQPLIDCSSEPSSPATRERPHPTV